MEFLPNLHSSSLISSFWKTQSHCSVVASTKVDMWYLFKYGWFWLPPNRKTAFVVSTNFKTTISKQEILERLQSFPRFWTSLLKKQHFHCWMKCIRNDIISHEKCQGMSSPYMAVCIMLLHISESCVSETLCFQPAILSFLCGLLFFFFFSLV